MIPKVERLLTPKLDINLSLGLLLFMPSTESDLYVFGGGGISEAASKHSCLWHHSTCYRKYLGATHTHKIPLAMPLEQYYQKKAFSKLLSNGIVSEPINGWMHCLTQKSHMHTKSLLLGNPYTHSQWLGIHKVVMIYLLILTWHMEITGVKHLQRPR